MRKRPKRYKRMRGRRNICGCQEEESRCCSVCFWNEKNESPLAFGKDRRSLLPFAIYSSIQAQHRRESHIKEERETNDKPLIYTAIYTLPPFEYYASSIHWIDYRLILEPSRSYLRTTHCAVGKIQSNASQPLQKCALPLESTTTHQRRHCRQERYGQQKSW